MKVEAKMLTLVVQVVAPRCAINAAALMGAAS
jgi:hypothetical protein